MVVVIKNNFNLGFVRELAVINFSNLLLVLSLFWSIQQNNITLNCMVIVEHNLVASMWDGNTSGVHSKVKIELYVLSKIKQPCSPVIVEIALSEVDCLEF